MDHLLAAPQLAASQMKHEIAEAHRLDRRHRRHDGAAQDAGDAQRELARLERLRHIVVRAQLEAGDAAVGLGFRGQHQDRHRRSLAQRFRELEAGLARHHHVEYEQIEREASKLGARIRRIVGRGDAIALAVQEAREQVADATVVVDHEQMRRIVGKRERGLGHHDFLSVCRARGRPVR